MGSTGMVDDWTILQTDPFVRQMKQYTRNTELCEKLNEMVELLKHEDDPRRVGDRKAGQFKGVYTIRLSKQHRLMYQVIDDKHEVRLHKIGDHKQVYGHD